MAAPLCHCKDPVSAELKVARTAANAGREFWGCDACYFFRWADAKATDLSLPGPPCKCK